MKDTEGDKVINRVNVTSEKLDKNNVMLIAKEIEEVSHKAVEAAVEWSERVSEAYQIGPKEYGIMALDGANAFRAAVAHIFGTEERGVAIPPSMFSAGQPPSRRTVDIQLLHIELPSGELVTREHLDSIPLLDLWIKAENNGIVPKHRTPNSEEAPELVERLLAIGTLDSVSDAELQVPWNIVRIYNPDGTTWGQAHLEENEDGMFVLTLITKRGRSETADRLMLEVERQFRFGSIYKNRIYDWNNKKFVRPVYDAERTLVLNTLAEDQKRGNIIHRIKYHELVQRRYPQLARANALEFGDYGGGKSTSHAADMWYALRHGWTVIQWSPKSEADRKSYADIVAFAGHLNSPVLILVEDFETMLPSTGDGEEFRGLLDTMDNATNKSLPLITTWTTNFPEKLPPGVWRRFDFAMEFGLPESPEKYKEFVQVKRGLLDRVCPAYVVKELAVEAASINDGLDLLAQGLYDAKAPQWLVTKAVESAICYALPQPEDQMIVTPNDIWTSFKSLAPLWDRFASSEELEAIHTLERELERLIKKAVEATVQEQFESSLLK